MKIILTKDVKKQGKSGDVLEVKDGFGMFLVNKGDAVMATPTSLNRLDKENLDKKEQEIALIKECESIKKKLEAIKITFKVKTGAQDKVFGTISPKQIVEELSKKGYNIDKKQINIASPISSLGFHNINIELHKKVIATLKIELVK